MGCLGLIWWAEGLSGLDWGGCLIRLMVLGGVWFVNYEGPFGLSN